MAYTAEQRRQAVEAVKRGASYSAVARHMGADKEHVAKWCKEPEKWCVDASAEAIAQAFGVAPKSAAPSFANNPGIPDSSRGKVVMVIPDLHCPWEHPDALNFLKAVESKWNPDIYVNLGDEVDFYGMSRFDHDPDVVNPGKELSLAVKHLLPFYKEFPNMLVCQSNHTHRVHAKASKSGLPASTIKSIEEILQTPEGWIYKHCHTIDNVQYKHGMGKSGPNAHINHAKATGISTAIGHIHAFGGVNYLRPGLFAANFSCLIDRKAPCFSYAAEMDDNIVMGCGIVVDGKVAYFIPMIVDANDRWTGILL